MPARVPDRQRWGLGMWEYRPPTSIIPSKVYLPNPRLRAPHKPAEPDASFDANARA
ncbi:hypothetical protein K523DRAFT_358784 [Schizophyllum commune Tattone D]|nr:hypothetical protein K523DRAFT_358784 [Schizophyllum commune Tattone D]